MINVIELGGGSGGGGVTSYSDLTDKTTVDLPIVNTPLAAALNGKEDTVNKKTDVDANKTSDTFFPTIKAVFDWVTGLFVKGSASSVDNAVARFDGETGKLVQSSNVTVGDTGNILSANPLARLSLGLQGNNGDAHIGASGIVTPPSGGTQDYGLYLSHNVYRDVDGYYKHSRTYTIPGVLLRVGGGVSTGFHGVSIDYTPNVGTANITNFTSLLKIGTNGLSGVGLTGISPTAQWDINGTLRCRGAIIDSTGSAGSNGQVLKNVAGLPVWSNP